MKLNHHQLKVSDIYRRLKIAQRLEAIKFYRMLGLHELAEASEMSTCKFERVTPYCRCLKIKDKCNECCTE